jgi:hypothetical protein
MRARAMRRCLLPYAGMTQIRFEGYFSAPKQRGTPSNGVGLLAHRTRFLSLQRKRLGQMRVVHRLGLGSL